MVDQGVEVVEYLLGCGRCILCTACRVCYQCDEVAGVEERVYILVAGAERVLGNPNLAGSAEQRLFDYSLFLAC
eukprot:3068599-Prymnesium_polylepis.1